MRAHRFLVLTFALAACGSPTGPGNQPPPVDSRIRIELIAATPAAAASATDTVVNLGRDSIVVRVWIDDTVTAGRLVVFTHALNDGGFTTPACPVQNTQTGVYSWATCPVSDALGYAWTTWTLGDEPARDLLDVATPCTYTYDHHPFDPNNPLDAVDGTWTGQGNVPLCVVTRIYATQTTAP